jgi:hypothetical protein
MGALFNQVRFDSAVRKEFMSSDRPKVQKEQHSIKCNRENKTPNRKQILLICHLPSKLVAHDGRNKHYNDEVNSKVGLSPLQ